MNQDCFSKKHYNFGVVKWFGGYNKLKNRDNDFGFIEAIDNSMDVYFHKSSVKNINHRLKEGDLVLYKLEKYNGKEKAKKVLLLLNINDRSILAPLNDALKVKQQCSSVIKNTKIMSFISEVLKGELGNDLFSRIIKESENVINVAPIISKSEKWIDFFSGHFGHLDLLEIEKKGIDLTSIPNDFIDENLLELQFIIDFESESRGDIKIIEIVNHISTSSLLYLIFTDSICNKIHIRNRTNDIHNFINNSITENSEGFTIDKYNKKHNIEKIDFVDFLKNPIIKEIIKTHNIDGIFNFFSFSEIEKYGFEIPDLSESIIDERISDFKEYLLSKTESERLKLLNLIIDHISLSAILYYIFKGVILDSSQLGNRLPEVSRFFNNCISKKEDYLLENFVRESYKERFLNIKEFKEHPIVKPLITEVLIREKIYKKDMSFVEDLLNNRELLNVAEFYILYKLIPLISPNNSYEIIGDILQNDIWEGFKTGRIKLSDNSIFKLFPQCRVMHSINLSCEAFHWIPPLKEKVITQSIKEYEKYKLEYKKEDVFLCRKKKCIDPKVLPNTAKNFLDFTIYDWLSHYNVNYENSEKPSKKDFPIKLAGYLNRLKELYSRLHCRSCNTLLNYTPSENRTKKIKFYNSEKSSYEYKELFYSYRVTLFKCGTKGCKEYLNDIYINHCLNYKCRSVIDSRDNIEKCENGFYICSCRSCCREH